MATIAQQMPMAQFVTSWINRAEDVRLDFYSIPKQANTIELIAKLFQKNVSGTFADTNVTIPERAMTIEMENLEALMRNIPQKTFNLSQLSTTQKTAIMQSLESRNISVERSFNSGSITIHALP